jgi:hypothetical protein
VREKKKRNNYGTTKPEKGRKAAALVTAGITIVGAVSIRTPKKFFEHGIEQDWNRNESDPIRYQWIR